MGVDMTRVALLLFFVTTLSVSSQWFPSSTFSTDAIQSIEFGVDGSAYLWLNEQNGTQVHHVVKRQTLDAPSTLVWSRKQDSISDGLRGLWLMPNDVLLWTDRGIESATRGTSAFSCWDKLLTLDALVPTSDTSIISAATVSFLGDSGSPKAIMRCFQAGEKGSCQEVLSSSPRDRIGRVTCIGLDTDGSPLLSFGYRKNPDNIRVPHWFIYKNDTLRLKGLKDLDVYDAVHVSKTNSGWVFAMKRVTSTTETGEEANDRIIETDEMFNVVRNVELGVRSMSTIKKAKRRGDLVLVAADSAVYVYQLSRGLIQTVAKSAIARSIGIESWKLSVLDADIHDARLYIVLGSGIYVASITTTSVLDDESSGVNRALPIVDAAYYYDGSVDGSETVVVVRDLLGRQVGTSIASRERVVRVDCKSIPNGVYTISDVKQNTRTVFVSH
jgi:hypothetical protein